MTVGDAQGRAGCLHSERRGGNKVPLGSGPGAERVKCIVWPGVDSPAELHRVSNAPIYNDVRQHVGSTH